MLTLVKRLSPNPAVPVRFTLALTAAERTRSRYRWQTPTGEGILLHLPRGTVLRDGDLLAAEAEEPVARVLAQPEPVLIVTAKHPLDLLRAAYHLGNRHVALEIEAHCLKLSPDPVLQAMLEQLGLQVIEAIQSFQPESGAYHPHNHAN